MKHRIVTSFVALLAFAFFTGIAPADEQVLLSQERVTTSGGFGTGDGQSFILPGKTTLSAVEVLLGPESELARANLWETERVTRRLNRTTKSPWTHGTIENHTIPGKGTRWVRIDFVKAYRNQSTEAVELALDFTFTTKGKSAVTKIAFSESDPYPDGTHIRWADWMDQYLVLRSARDLTFRLIGDGFPAIPKGWSGDRALLLRGDDGCYAIYFGDQIATSVDLTEWWYPWPQPKSPLIIEPGKSSSPRRKYYRSVPYALPPKSP